MIKSLYFLICFLLLFVAPLQQVHAENPPSFMDRGTWIKLSTREKTMYIQGFTRGLAMGAAMPKISQLHIPGWKVNDIVLYTNRFYGNRLNARISVPFIYMIQSLDMQGSKHEDIDEVVENFRRMNQAETVHWLRSAFATMNEKPTDQP